MKRIITLLVLSLFIFSGSGIAFANKDKSKGNHKQEQTSRPRPGSSRQKPTNIPNRNNNGIKGSMPRPGQSHTIHPQGPNNVIRAPRISKSYQTQLDKMVRYAARGAKDVSVWQIDPETFIIRYLLGNQYYTQKLYPGSCRYGARSVINNGWSPLSSWSLLPPINININL